MVSQEKKKPLYKKLINLVQFLICHKKARKFVFWCIMCNHAASTGFTGNTKLAQIISLMIGTAYDTVRITEFSGNKKAMINITKFLEHVTHTHDFSIIHSLTISFVHLFLAQ
jgi:hypothetical protein